MNTSSEFLTAAKVTALIVAAVFLYMAWDALQPFSELRWALSWLYFSALTITVRQLHREYKENELAGAFKSPSGMEIGPTEEAGPGCATKQRKGLDIILAAFWGISAIFSMLSIGVLFATIIKGY